MRSNYAQARSITDDLLEIRARQQKRHAAEWAELRVVIGRALLLEKALRADGNPERTLGLLGMDMPTDEAATSTAAD